MRFNNIFKKLLVAFMVISSLGNGYIVKAENLVNTDYIHSFEYDINNLLDKNPSSVFKLPDFVNYLEFKLEPDKKLAGIKFLFDSVNNNYQYKIYSSKDGYEYNEVKFQKEIIDDFNEIAKVSVVDPFIRIRIIDSESPDFINIGEIEFLDSKGNSINTLEVEKQEPVIERVVYEDENKFYINSIKELLGRVLGKEYVEFFDVKIALDNKDYDYFTLASDNNKIYVRGNNVNSIAIGLNYYFEHYLKQTYDRFGDSKIKVVLPLPKIEGVVKKIIDAKYRYNFNYVAYGYTMAYWDFEQWEREIDWMALNGYNMALNLVGHEEVVRRFLSELGYSFSEITKFLTSPVYLPWQFMGNISRVGGEMTPKWFEDRAKLSIQIQKRMKEYGISPVGQTYVGYIPRKEELGINILPGAYWSKIKGPDRVDFNQDYYEKVAKVFYDKQREILGDTKFFMGDIFHEGSNAFGYNVSATSKRILDALKENEGNDAIWIFQSWGHNPSSELLSKLSKENVLILDLHSQLNVRWKGYAKFNGMTWNGKEFDGNNWIFSVLNNFGGRNGLYGHTRHLINEYYDAKENAKYLVGIGNVPEAVGYNDFIDELISELIFKDRIDFDEFVHRYLENRYGKYNENIKRGFDVLLDTVYNPVTEEYHEGASESIINARPSMNVVTASKWGKIHKNYNSDILEKALVEYFSVFDQFKSNKNYINDIVEIASQVITNLASDYYKDIQKAYNEKNIEELKTLKDKFLYLINLDANILAYNDRKSLKEIMDKVEKLGYDDYFEDNLKYNKKTLITTWYDKLVSEDDGLRDYANSDYYELVGNLYYKRWERYFNQILSNSEEEDPYDDYKFDLDWIYDDNSLNFDRSKKSLKELLNLVIVDAELKKTEFSFLSNLIYSISSLFK